MKYLKNKNARRRGIAMEMALLALMVLTAMSVISITATMIQVNKYEDVHDAFEEKAAKFNLEAIGEVYFKELPDYLDNLEGLKASLNDYIEGVEVKGISIESEKYYIGTFQYLDTKLTIKIEKIDNTFTIKEWKYN